MKFSEARIGIVKPKTAQVTALMTCESMLNLHCCAMLVQAWVISYKIYHYKLGIRQG